MAPVVVLVSGKLVCTILASVGDFPPLEILLGFSDSNESNKLSEPFSPFVSCVHSTGGIAAVSNLRSKFCATWGVATTSELPLEVALGFSKDILRAGVAFG